MKRERKSVKSDRGEGGVSERERKRKRRREKRRK